MKRFYKMVSTAQGEAGWEIHLDGKAVKTPLRVNLVAPNEDLAQAAMAEWAAQNETIEPDTMPLTQLLSTKIDRIATEREAMRAAILKYLDTDLLCYRTDNPAELGERQAAAWDPHLKWFEKTYGTALQVTDGLAALMQDNEAHAAVRAEVDKMDDDHFTILQLVTPLCGSLVLALAFVAQQISAENIMVAARVEETYKDEIFNAEKHGPDPAQAKKDKAARRDLEAAEIYLRLL